MVENYREPLIVLKSEREEMIETLHPPITFKAKSWLLQFTPFSHQCRNTNNCIIGNGIGKSGTYFLNRIIECLDHWENIKVHILPHGWMFTKLLQVQDDFVFHKCVPQYSVKKLRNGQFVAAHLPWDKKLEQVIENTKPMRRIKHILMYRDPRDTFVSYMRFVISPTYYWSPKARARHDFVKNNFSNDDDRLTYIIQKRIKNPRCDFSRYEPWLKSSNCCTISFEELLTEFLDKLATKENQFGNVLKKIFDYLEVDVSTIDPINFYRCVYGKSITASEEKNKIGQYKRYFKEHHYKMLDNPEFRKILDVFGYEW
jgi:hypothetical protein